MRQSLFKSTSINTSFGRITALRGTRNLAVYPILSRFLRSVRLLLHPKLCIYRSALKFLFCSLLFFSIDANAALSDISHIYQQVPALYGFDVCSGGGCAEVSHLSLSDDEWQSIVSIFMTGSLVANAEQERNLIAHAIGAFERIVGAKNHTDTDRAGTFGNSNYPGQLDCNDEAINSTTYMRLLRQNGLIKFHEIEDMRTRNFFFTGWPHSTAVIHETATGQRFAVDSWFYNNGSPATIVPFSVWKSGYVPKNSPLFK